MANPADKQRALEWGMNRLEADQRTTAERQWCAPLKPRANQQPCDVGLFSDEASQLDLIEMFQNPIEED